MSKPKSLWLTIAAALACIGCCSVPLYALFIGSAGITLLWNGAFIEVLKCILPLVILAIGYWTYQKRKTSKQCCSSPESGCSNKKCEFQVNVDD